MHSRQSVYLPKRRGASPSTSVHVQYCIVRHLTQELLGFCTCVLRGLGCLPVVSHLLNQYMIDNTTTTMVKILGARGVAILHGTTREKATLHVRSLRVREAPATSTPSSGHLHCGFADRNSRSSLFALVKEFAV
jgi:hypothetical protein